MQTLRTAQTLLLCVLGLVNGCKPRNPSSETRNQDSTATSLRASDLSVYIPLSRNAPNGICNAPGLDLDGTHAIIPKTDFLQMATTVFIESPMKAGKYIRKQANKPPKENAEFNQKIQKIHASAGSPEELQQDLMSMCEHLTAEPNIRELTQETFEDLMKIDLSATTPEDDVGHLPIALARHKDHQICRYESWRIVGMRFDICSNRAQLPEMHEAAGIPTQCEGEIRLVAQPVLCENASGAKKCLDNNASLTTKDFTFHLIFQPANNWQGFTERLRELASISRQQNPAWSFEENERLLKPHYGLATEQAMCDGPVAKTFHGIIKDYATYNNLVNLTWMGTSDGPAHWSFGSAKKTEGKWTALATENFNSTLREKNKFPFDEDLKRHFALKSHHVARYFDGSSGTFLPSDTVGNLTVLNDVLNPLKISQLATNDLPIPASAVSSSCITCHLSQQTLTTLALKKSIPLETAYAEGGYTAAKQFTGPAPVWPDFDATKTGERGFKHLRNFGYGLDMTYGVSRRVINETDDLLVLINHFGL